MNRTYVPVIYDCNDNCISCPVPRKGQRENPTYEDIIKEVDEIKNHSNHIEFNGGEPTIRKDLLKILYYADTKGFNEITLLTNARLFFYEEIVKKFAKISNLKIDTTLYGSTSIVHDSITRTPNTFNFKVKGIQNLLKYGIPVELRVLVHKMNYLDFENIINLIIDKFPQKELLRIVIMNPKLTATAWQNRNAVGMKLSEIAKYLEKPIQNLNSRGYNVNLYHFPQCILTENIRPYSRGQTSSQPEIKFLNTCEECKYRKNCSGVWSSYLAHFGENEFNPILEIQELINHISIDDEFFLDKLYYLFGFKDVLRLEKKYYSTTKDMLKGLSDQYEEDQNFIYVSKDNKKSNKAKKITSDLKKFSGNYEKESKLNIEIANLYGYPICCAKSFNDMDFSNDKDIKYKEEIFKFKYKDYELNTIHYPCKSNCEKTKEIQKRFKKLFEKYFIKNEN
ncbi:MAG: radical SAM protein [Nanoarchaeota archaeon]